MLDNPKADNLKVGILTSALVELGNELGIDFSQSEIAWNVYWCAHDKYDGLITHDFRVERAFDDIREVLSRPSKARLKEMKERRDRRDFGQPESDSPRRKVLSAVFDLLHNPETPADLYEAVAEFICEATTTMEENVLHSEDSLNRMLNAVPADDRRGALLAARAKKEAQEVAQ